MKEMASIAIKATVRSKMRLISPCLAPSKDCPIALGKPDTILAKIISEMPFPIPLSFTCSPSQTKNIVPVTKETTAVNMNMVPGSIAIPWEERAIANPID